jgi:dolichol kinase
MSGRDLLGLVLSYLYAFGMLFGTEALGRWVHWRQSFTRKLVHIGAGLWVWAIVALFDHWYIGVIPFATFIVLNYVFYRQRSFSAVDGSESTPGTVYFAASITILFVLLWRTGGARDHGPIAVAATMAMTVGDAFASLIGERWGERRYAAWGHSRSWEGTVAMGVSSFMCIGATLLWLPGSRLSPNSVRWTVEQVLFLTSIASVVATGAEALSPAGTDNLSVPLLSALVLYALRNVP